MLSYRFAFLALIPMLVPSGVCLCQVHAAHHTLPAAASHHGHGPDCDHGHQSGPERRPPEPTEHAPGCPAAQPVVRHQLQAGGQSESSPPVTNLFSRMEPATAAPLLARPVPVSPIALTADLPLYLSHCALRN
jgi:hypothetical protein